MYEYTCTICAQDGSSTLLEFTVQQYIAHWEPEAAQGSEKAAFPFCEPAAVERAALCSFDELHRELTSVRVQLTGARLSCFTTLLFIARAPLSLSVSLSVICFMFALQTASRASSASSTARSRPPSRSPPR